MRRIINCQKCGKKGFHAAFNICTKCYWKEYYHSNLLKLKKYKKENMKLFVNWNKKDKLINPSKYNARNYANNNKQRDVQCINCNSTKCLHFHHTNYERNEGFTVCKDCHLKVHGV